MDLEMPLMDGIETVRALRRRGDRLPVIIFTAVSAQDAKATFNALAAGATDFVTKPSSMISDDASLEDVARQLIARVKALVPHAGVRPAVPGTAGRTPACGTRALTLAMSCLATSSRDASSLIMLEGLVTKSVAPAARALNVALASCALTAVNMMTGSRSPRRRNALTVSIPSIKGISRSMVTRSAVSYT